MLTSSTFKQTDLLALPEHLVVDFSRVFFIVDRLAQHTEFPPIDPEAMMQVLVEQLHTQPTEYNWRHKLWELTLWAADGAHLDEHGYEYDMFQKHIFQVFYRAEMYLTTNQLYVLNRLPYDYVQRLKSGSALLRRHSAAPR